MIFSDILRFQIMSKQEESRLFNQITLSLQNLIWHNLTTKDLCRQMLKKR